MVTPLSVFPSWLLLPLLVVACAASVFWLKRFRRLLVITVIVYILQVVIAATWVLSMTPASVFVNGRPNASHILDPVVETWWMRCYWVVAWLCIGVLSYSCIVRVARAENVDERKNVMNRISCTLVLQLCVMVAIWSNMADFRRMPGHLTASRSISPSHRVEVCVVPMDCLIDVNGVVLVRRDGDFWWRSVGTIGDALSFCEDVEFAWNESETSVTVTLLRSFSDASTDNVMQSFDVPDMN